MQGITQGVEGIIVIDEPIQLSEGFDDTTDKINYEVPTNKIFKITGWTATLFEGKMQIEFRINGTIFDGAGLNFLSGSFASRSVDPQTPIAIATAGQIVDVFRAAGDMSKDWFTSIQGYLKDA